jgi:sugar phosphate isomerase/epimerase
LGLSSRRRFLAQSGAAAGSALLWPALQTAAAAADSGPNVAFPTQPRERISIASYPFREVIAGSEDRPGARSNAKMDVKDFAAHVSAKLNIKKIEPWSQHFRSLDTGYLAEFRAAVKKAQGAIVNIAVDGTNSPYAQNPAEREKAASFSKQWVDAAVAVGSPSIRTNIPAASDSEPDVDRAAETLGRVAVYAASKNVVVHLENDNPLSEDPFFIVKVIEKVNSPWLHALPDFANSLASNTEEHAYSGLQAMFGHAYGICHVKEIEADDQGKMVRADLARTFGMLKSSNYRGYCSIEWDSPGDPYAGTADLIQKAIRYLS